MSKSSRPAEVEVPRFASMFKALSNPHRLKIFLRLARCCEPAGGCCESIRSCVGELGEDLGIVPSTLSHHLRELERAGLIRSERNGQRVECWVEEPVLERLGDFFEAVRGT